MYDTSLLYRHLLLGEVIDKVRFASDFEWLCQEQSLLATNDWLDKLQMECVKLNSGAGFYAVYKDSHRPATQKAIKRLFEESSKILKPLVLWLGLCLHICHDRPLQAGDKLYHSEMLAALEESLHLQEQLSDIAKSINRGVDRTPKDQLNALLEFLKNNDYLITQGSSGAVYIATAKWDLLYENLSLIAEYENLSIDNTLSDTANQLGISYS